MTKSDIAAEMAVRLGLSQRQALNGIDTIILSVRQALLNDRRIEIRGFAVFEPRPRKRGFGRDILRGKSVAIPEGRSVRFKPGLNLRDLG